MHCFTCQVQSSITCQAPPFVSFALCALLGSAALVCAFAVMVIQ